MSLQVKEGENALVITGSTYEVIEYLKMDDTLADAVTGVLMGMNGEIGKDRAVLNLKQDPESAETLVRVSITEDEITIDRGPHVQHH